MKIQSEIKLLEKIRESLLEAGIYDRAFLGFGTLLGAVRPTKRTNLEYRLGLMEHDHDADLKINPSVSPEEKEKYFQICKKKGLFNWPSPSSRIQRKPDGEIIWFSLKEKKHGARCCNWFSFVFKGYLWHSKGKKWINNEKFDIKKFNYDVSYAAIAKGTPAKFYEKFMEISFEGMKFNVPATTGSLLDLWYPGWSIPRKGGASKKDTVLIIKNWDNQKSWRIQ